MMLRTVLLLAPVLIFINGAPPPENEVVPLLREGTKSYHLATNYKLSFLQAMKYCKNINMSLLTIESKEENEIIYKFIRNQDTGREYWSSGSRLVGGKYWIWLSNGDPIKYANWNNLQPEGNSKHCIDLRYNNNNQLFWHNENCNIERPFICEKNENYEKEDKKSLWSKIMESSANINADILRYKNKIFYFNKIFKGTFWKAAQFCDILGLKSVAIEDKEENKAIFKYLKDTNADLNWWTSGTKTLDGITWFWLSNGHKVDYTNWHPVEPNNANEQCLNVIVDKGEEECMFNDKNCNIQLPIICEYSTEEFEIRRKRDSRMIMQRLLQLKTVNVGKYYHVETESQGNQLHASTFCDSLNMDLVDITKADENKYIVELIVNIEDGPFWTSGIKVNNNWQWQKTKNKLTYTNWKIGKPNTSANHKCMLIDRYGNWIDRECNYLHPFICESRSTNSVTPTEVDPLDEKDCKQPVINIYINNNAAVKEGQELSPMRIDNKSVGDDKSYLVKNKWNSCK